MRIHIRRRKSKQGVAAVLMASIFILFAMAILFAFLNFGVTNTYTAVVNGFGTSIFNPLSNLTFALQIWYFWLLVVFFSVVVFILQQSQRRKPNYDV